MCIEPFYVIKKNRKSTYHSNCTLRRWFADGRLKSPVSITSDDIKRMANGQLHV